MDIFEKQRLIQEILGEARQQNQEYLYTCPYCHHRKKKMSLNYEKNKYKCWVCGKAGNDIRQLVKQFGTYSQLSEWDYSTGSFSELFQSLEQIGGEESRSFELSEEEYEEINIKFKQHNSHLLINKIFNLPVEIEDYLRRRKLNNPYIWIKEKFYYESIKGETYLIIPSYDINGKLNMFSKINVITNWKQVIGFGMTKIIPNEYRIDWEKPIFLFENILDAIKLQNYNSIYLNGSVFNIMNYKVFREIIIKGAEVVFCFDNDAKKKVAKYREMLYKYGINSFAIFPEEFQDWKFMSSEEMQSYIYEAYKNKESFDIYNLNYVFNNLEGA